MSLLMEALRKAEEAKSKASQEEKKSTPPGADSDDPAARTAAAESGPAVINPDPDEEEILSSHSSDSVLELVDKEEDLEKIEFSTLATENDDAGPDELTIDDFDDGEAESDSDDGLSLLQSSYFTRTKNTGSSLDDDFDDEDSGAYEEPEEDGPGVAAMAEPQPVVETRPAPPPAKPAPVTQTESAAERKSRDRAERDSASALFLAKEDSQKRRLKKLGAIAAVALVVPLAGIMFWLFTSLGSGQDMQFNVPAGGNVANRSFSDAFAQPENTPAEQVADTTAPATTPAEQAVTETPESDSTANRLQALADNADPEQPAPEPQVQVPVPEPREVPAPDATAQATPTPPAQDAGQAATPVQQTAPITASTPANAPQPRESGLSFERTEREQVLNPDLVAAYESYQQADYNTASRLYQQVLASEPTNRDALLHLASVHLKQANPALARNLYSRLLELNPRDPLARAGILETVQGDPARQETELKSLVMAFPDTPQLSFALGNLYAKQNRWSEAQSAYFDALLAAKANNSGPVSPDYAFNLAVSLERISQLRSALDYYREAEILSRTARPGFDPALLDQRLMTLEQRLR